MNISNLNNMKHPIIQTIIAILLGISVLILSSILVITLSNNPNIITAVPALSKTLTHTSMLVFSALYIIILSKRGLHYFGFVWNTNFPIFRIVLVSLFIGMVPSLLNNIIFDNVANINPTANFTLIEKIVFIWIWASLCEEILTRGLIQGFLSPFKNIGIKIFNTMISLPVVVGAIFFGSMHLMLLTMGVELSSVIIIVIFSIVLGGIAGYQREITNSLLPAIIVHMCFNISASLVSMINL